MTPSPSGPTLRAMRWCLLLCVAAACDSGREMKPAPSAEVDASTPADAGRVDDAAVTDAGDPDQCVIACLGPDAHRVCPGELPCERWRPFDADYGTAIWVEGWRRLALCVEAAAMCSTEVADHAEACAGQCSDRRCEYPCRARSTRAYYACRAMTARTIGACSTPTVDGCPAWEGSCPRDLCLVCP